MNYIANNKGQEAFQLLYERLWRIHMKHDTIPSYMRDNGFHLCTLLNTFNRHYCHEVMLDHDDKIVPVFLNLQRNDVWSLHRLLAVDLKCHYKDNRRDTFILVFDDAIIGDDDDDDYHVFYVTLGEFKQRHYTRELYHFEYRDYDELSLRFDSETVNFNYYDEEAKSSHERFIVCTYYDEMKEQYYGYPPFFGNLYRPHSTGSGYRDTTNLYLYTARDAKGLWYVNHNYVAPNRIQKKTPVMDQAVVGYSALGRFVIDFLFGVNDLVYMAENFKGLRYVAKSSIAWDTRVTGLASYKKLKNITCIDRPLALRTHLLDSSLKDDATNYIEGEAQLNNYVNTLVYTTFDISRYIIPSDPITKEEKKYSVIDWRIITIDELQRILSLQHDEIRAYERYITQITGRINEMIT